MKIAVFSAKEYDKTFFEKANIYNFNIKYYEESLEKNSASLTQGFDAICAFVNDNLNDQVINILKENNIKIIAMRCAGTNNVDLKKAKENNIYVTNVKKYSPNAIAEHTVGLILSLNRCIHKAYLRIKNLNFSIDGFLGFDLFEKTVGIIGFGKIGQTVAKILLAFGCKILVYDPKGSKKNNKVIFTDLQKLYESSDIITLHCPLKKETHHMINEKSLSYMKKGVMLINTARGALIDTKSVIDKLRSNHIGYLGLDVYEKEKNIFFHDLSKNVLEDKVFSELLTFENVLITSHQAFFTKEALIAIAKTSLKNINDIKNGDLSNELTHQF